MAQNEPPDFPGTGTGPAYVLVVGANTYSGSLQTPSDGQDRFQITLGAGQTITSITASINNSSNPNGFFDVNGSNVAFPGGNISPVPVGAGTYQVLIAANFAVGNAWTMTVNVTGGPPPCTNPTVPSVTATPSSVCPGGTTTLTISGTLNDATSWAVYAGSCGGTLLGNTAGSTFVVSPGNPSTTYYVRGEGGCVTPGSCGSVTVNGSDTTPPNAVCQNINVQLDASGMATIVATAVDGGSTDNCGIASRTVSPNTFDCSNIGTNTVILTVTDNSGNITSCNATVTIQDAIFPVISCIGNIIVNNDPGICGALITYSIPAATDNCSATVTQTDGSGYTSGSIFPIGTTTLQYTATDPSGNTDSCSFTVTVTDNENPVITCPNDINQGNDAGICGAVINYSIPFSDNCSGSFITQIAGLASGSIFPIGTTTNTFEATDLSGNVTSCSFDVTINDVEAPTITCAANATRDAELGVCQYTVVGTEFDATYTDNCTGGTLTNDLNGTATLTGEILSTGITTVVWTVDDGNGQTATCTTVITIEDNEVPIIICPSDINVNTDVGNCFATVNFSNAIVFDNCGVDSVVQTMGLASGSPFPVGVNTIEFTATDINGNISMCSFTITVTDNEAPVAICQNITIQLDANGNVIITPANVDGGSTDQCGVVTATIDIDTFDCSHVGNNNVILTVTDGNGNSSSCTAIVTIEDVTPPVVACQDITVELDPATGTVTISGTEIDNGSTDACGIANYELDVDTFDCTNIGDNTVILTVTDVNGNTATCTATVTVEDNTAPQLVCQDFTIEIGTDGTATLAPSDVIASNDDACGIFTTAVDITEFSCADIGTPVTVQVFSQDNNGNLSTCMATVTAVDVLAPEVTCPADQTVDPGAGNLFYIVPDYFGTGEAMAIDNCTTPVIITTQDPAIGTPLPDGTYTITLTAEDEYGNVGTCTFELIVESILGVNNNNQNLGTLQLYPNPAKDVITIGNPQNLELEYADIYDLNGRLVHSYSLKGMTFTKSININNLDAATYLVIIRGKEGQITKRLLKEQFL